VQRPVGEGEDRLPVGLDRVRLVDARLLHVRLRRVLGRVAGRGGRQGGPVRHAPAAVLHRRRHRHRGPRGDVARRVPDQGLAGAEGLQALRGPRLGRRWCCGDGERDEREQGDEAGTHVIKLPAGACRTRANVSNFTFGIWSSGLRADYGRR
jgi:hypothetical protein